MRGRLISFEATIVYFIQKARQACSKFYLDSWFRGQDYARPGVLSNLNLRRVKNWAKSLAAHAPVSVRRRNLQDNLNAVAIDIDVNRLKAEYM